MGQQLFTFQGHRCTPSKTTDDHCGKMVPHVKVVVNTSAATYYQTDIVSHGGTLMSYDDEEKKSGTIQVYHRVDPVKEDRFVFVIDWIVKNIEDSCRSMNKVRDIKTIRMSDKLLLRFKDFMKNTRMSGICFYLIYYITKYSYSSSSVALFHPIHLLPTFLPCTVRSAPSTSPVFSIRKHLEARNFPNPASCGFWYIVRIWAVSETRVSFSILSPRRHQHHAAAFFLPCLKHS